MSTYTLVPRSQDTGFDVVVVTSTGTRHTLLGFEDEAAAQAWIAHDKRVGTGERHDYDDAI